MTSTRKKMIMENLGPLGLRHFHNDYPGEVLSCLPGQLDSILGGPTLIEIDSEISKPQQTPGPLFVSTLLHGNEHTGFYAMQSLLKDIKSGKKKFPRKLFLLLGNTRAAAKNVRVLNEQTDFNRIWSEYTGAEYLFVDKIKELVAKIRPFAAVDLHNNTGLNPHYACIAQVNAENLNLARLFSRHVMIFRKPCSTFGVSFSSVCPTVTIEAGLSGDETGIAHVKEYIESLLHLGMIPQHNPFPFEIDLCENVFCVKLKQPDQTRVISIEQILNSNEDVFEADPEAFLFLRSDIDRLNFSELKNSVLIGRTKPQASFPFVIDCVTECAKLQSPCIDHRSDGHVFFTSGALPSMLSPKIEAMQLDCVGYLMKKVQF